MNPPRLCPSLPPMRMALCVLLLLQVAGIASAAPVPRVRSSRAEGVLLGFQTEQGLETWFADRHGLTRLGAGLAVPRASGFWRLDVVAGRITFAPSGKVRPLPPPESSECGPSYELRLRSVRPDLISYEWTQRDGGCDEIPTVTLSRWGGTAKLDESLNGTSDLSDAQLLPIDAVFGPRGEALVDEASGDPSGFTGKRTNWLLTRDHAAAIFTDDDSEQSFEEDTLALELPAALRSPAKQHPHDANQIEAFGAPQGSFEVRVFADALEVWADGKRVEREVARPGELVLEQWAPSGSSCAALEAWKSEAAKALRVRSASR